MTSFIPAFRFSILTPMYDTFMRLAMKDVRLKTLLVFLMNPKAGYTVLDFGCGTGTLTIMIKRGQPNCIVEGVDIDPQILEIARRKARSRNIEINFRLYNGITLPYARESFEIVASSYVVHHLSREDKILLFREIFRVLKDKGKLYIMDFGIPRTWYAKAITLITRRVEPVEDNVLGRVPGYLEDADFGEIVELHNEGTAFGTVSVWRAEKVPFPGPEIRSSGE